MSVDALKKQLKQAYYRRPNDSSIEPRIEAIVENLKNNKSGKYKNCSDDDLRQIALLIISKNILSDINNKTSRMLEANGQPADPVWSQFTYEEILNMASAGVNVPQEFLDWAYSMSDADTTSYEIEDDSSEDPNVISHLELQTNDTTELEQQRRLQRLSSKAEKQDQLLINKKEKLNEQAADINSVQNDFNTKQKLTFDKINSFSDELNQLNQRLQRGEQLNDTELRKYKELSAALNMQGLELVANARNVEADLNALMADMADVNTLINVNNELAENIKSAGVLYAAQEGGKGSCYIKGVSGNYAFGDMASYVYAAQSNSIALSAGTIGINLNIDSEELQFIVNSNAAVSEIILNQVRSLNSNSGNLNTNAKPSAPENSQPLTEGEENPVSPVNQDTVEGNEPVVTGAAADVQETEDVAEVQEPAAGEVSETPDETNPLETALREYLDGCGSRYSEMQDAQNTVNNLRSDIKNIRKSRMSDMIKMASQFNSAFKQYSNLLEKVKKNKDFSNADQAEFLRLNAILDSSNGSIAMDMQTKIDVMDDYTSAIEFIQETSAENSKYGKQAVKSGVEYAKTQVEDFAKKRAVSKFMGKEKRDDMLYGKAGESISRDVIDSGNALIEQSGVSLKLLVFSRGLNNFASEYSAELGDRLAKNNAKTNPLTQEFNKLLVSKTQNNDDSSENSQNGQQTGRNSKTSDRKQERATADDVNNVENTGKAAETQAKNATQADKNAIKDKKEADKQIKLQQALMKRNAAQINQLTIDTNNANEQIFKLSAEAELENADIEALSESVDVETSTVSAAPQTRSLNSTAAAGASSDNSDSGAQIEAKLVKLGAIVQNSQQLGQRVTSNGRTIKVLESKSVKADKKLSTAAKAKYELTVQEQKAKEKEMKDNQKLTKTISDIGKVFTATKLAGMALMMTLWGASAGAVMFSIGKYGEIASYATNAAINVAQGNLLGAAINIGAAALSFMSTPPTSATATQGVKTAAKNGTDAVAKSTGTEVAKDTGTQVAKDAGAQAVKSTGTEVAKDAGAQAVKSTGTEVAKDAGAQAVKSAGTEVVKDAGSNTAANIAKDSLVKLPGQLPGIDVAVNVSKETIAAAAEESMKKMSEQLAVEAAKSIAKENTKIIIKNTLIEAAKSTLLKYGEKLQQKDTKEDKKKKVLVQFERKRRDALKRGIEKIKKSYRAR